MNWSEFETYLKSSESPNPPDLAIVTLFSNELLDILSMGNDTVKIKALKLLTSYCQAFENLNKFMSLESLGRLRHKVEAHLFDGPAELINANCAFLLACWKIANFAVSNAAAFLQNISTLQNILSPSDLCLILLIAVSDDSNFVEISYETLLVYFKILFSAFQNGYCSGSDIWQKVAQIFSRIPSSNLAIKEAGGEIILYETFTSSLSAAVAGKFRMDYIACALLELARGNGQSNLIGLGYVDGLCKFAKFNGKSLSESDACQLMKMLSCLCRDHATSSSKMLNLDIKSFLNCFFIRNMKSSMLKIAYLELIRDLSCSEQTASGLLCDAISQSVAYALDDDDFHGLALEILAIFIKTDGAFKGLVILNGNVTVDRIAAFLYSSDNNVVLSTLNVLQVLLQRPFTLQCIREAEFFPGLAVDLLAISNKKTHHVQVQTLLSIIFAYDVNLKYAMSNTLDLTEDIPNGFFDIRTCNPISLVDIRKAAEYSIISFNMHCDEELVVLVNRTKEIIGDLTDPRKALQQILTTLREHVGPCNESTWRYDLTQISDSQKGSAILAGRLRQGNSSTRALLLKATIDLAQSHTTDKCIRVAVKRDVLGRGKATVQLKGGESFSINTFRLEIVM